MKKSTLLMIVSVVLALTLSLGSTLAYLQDSDSDVNVMTLGSVYIEQIEQEWNADKTELQDFTQEKPLYPYVGELGWENDAEDGGAYRRFTMSNAVDKYVSVKNTGKSPAYVRTIIAFEMGQMDWDEFDKYIGISHNVVNGSHKFPGTWEWETPKTPVVIDGNNYIVWTATHKNPVAPGVTTIPSLLQVYLDKTAGNEEVEKVDGNGNGYYDILTLSQAVQTAGFTDAQTALDEAFGKVDDNVAEWFNGVTPPFDADNADDTWYDENATTLTIKNAQQLASFAEMVNAGNDFDNKIIVLENDIDLLGMEWTPIGRALHSANFNGTFDGQGHTVEHFTVNVDKYAGLFGYVGNHGFVKNLTVKNADIKANDYAGGIAGWVYGDVENCHAENVNVTVTPYWDASKNAYDGGAKAGGVVGAFGENNFFIKGCTAENVTIKGYRDLGGVVGMLGVKTTLSNCSAEKVSIQYISVEPYADNTENKNAGLIFGRNNGTSNTDIETDNTVAPETVTPKDELEEELTSNKEKIEVTLDNDMMYDVAAWSTDAMGGAVTKEVHIYGNGNTLTFYQTNSDWNNVVTNGATLYLHDVNITNAGENDGPWNRHDINFACDVVMENVTSDKALAFKAGAKLTNVTISDANTSDTYAIWIQPNGQTVTIKGCTIDMLACTDGRGIKIDEQYVSNPAKVTLKVSDTVFKTEEKSAILVKSKTGADIILNNIDISGVTSDSTNAVWVDSDSFAYFDFVNVTGGTKVQE